MKTLIIVESPKKVASLKKYLSNDYIVMSSVGHITELAKGAKHGLGVDIANGFKPKYVLMDDKIKVLNDLMQAAEKCDQILVASDPDREGEAIAWHLKERLKDMGKPIKRIEFHEIKKEAIIDAIKKPRDINMNLFHAQEGRRILDRIVGFTVSPYLINNYGKNLSAGRVQSVVTRMVTDREIEIESFVPEDYWTIQCNLAKADYKKDGTLPFIMKYNGKLVKEQNANNVFAKLNGKNFVVTEVVSDEDRKKPSPPMITSSMQQIMSKTHGFSADRTMKAAQALYEAGHCTYIRTDSVRHSEESLQELLKWLKTNNYSFPKKPYIYKNEDAAQDAHECIRPTYVTMIPGQDFSIIDKDQKLLYDMIWRYFIASQMNPAVYSTLKVTASPDDDSSVEVKASGKTIKDLGFLDILKIVDNSKIDIPNLEVGDNLILVGKNPVLLEKKQTKPPARFSESNIIDQLVKRKIGRPSTYADLLSKISSRNYVEKDGNIFHATDLGKKITSILIKNFKFIDYDYTADMEKQLDDIATGKISHIEMLNNFYTNFKKELGDAYIAKGAKLCEKCKFPMVEREVRATGAKFLACSNFSCGHTKNI